MRNYLAVLCAMIIVTGSIAQAPKHSKRITISTDASALENYHSVGRALLDKGYQIVGDKEFLTIKTADEQVTGSFAYAHFYFVCRDKEIEISGKATNNDVEKVYVAIENRGLNGSPLRESFEEMERLAASLGRISGYR